MARLRWPIRALFLCIGVLAAVPSRAAVGPGRPATNFGDITLTAPSFQANPSFHGYVEYRFLVTNHSSEAAHEVKLTLPRSKRFGPSLRSITCTVKVPPSSEKPVSLLQPALSLDGEDVEVTIDGRTQRNWVDLKGLQRPGVDSNNFNQAIRQPTVLVSQSANVNLGLDLPKANLRVQWVSKEAKAWSEQWLSYSSFDGAVVASGELKAMGKAVQSALWRYVESGGSLLIVGSWQDPAPWNRTAPLLIKPFPPSQAAPLLSYSAGFGHCLVSPGTDIHGLDRAQWRHIAESWISGPLPWLQVQTVTEANRAFPVVKDLSTPVRGLFLVMLLFAVTIGPVNLFVLSRKQRKIWLLWTVPAISLLTSVGVLGYMFLKEGWQGHARAEGLTILDQTAGRATTVGWIGFYTPLTPGDGLHFGKDTELTPQLWHDPQFQDQRQSTRTIDWSDDQHLAAGWVTARMPAHFVLRKSEARPERVTVRQAKDGSLTVMNGLGVDIRRFWYADHLGKIHAALDIPAQGQAILKPRGDAIARPPEVKDLRQAYASSWLTLYEALTDHPERYLRPGCSIAALDDAPFIEPGLPQAQTRQGRSVVYIIHKRS